jgi:hypothetical protein
VLTELQQEVARLLAALPEATGFALAGGGALIVRGDVDRGTKDLDFFAPPPSQVERLLPAFEETVTAAGMTLEVQQAASGFARLIVRRGDDTVSVDLGTDGRIRPVEPSALGPVLAGEELAADKLLALFGRAEARDFVDVLALEARYGLDRMCQLALEKDRGFRRDVLAVMLDRFDRLSPEDFAVDQETYLRLQDAVQRWSVELTTPGEQQQWPPRRGPEHDTGAGL